MKNKYVLILIVVVLLVGIFFLLPKKQTEPTVNPLATYTNDEYGFEVSYPKNLTPDPVFGSYYHLANGLWRVDALTGEDGKGFGRGIISIPEFRTASDNSYPRYFDAELRIGASANPKDVATCLEPGQVEPSLSPSTEVIGGVTFDKFPIGSAGMMQYLKGFSYRTTHNGTCFALEQLETGSNYRDDPSSAKDIPDAQLNAYFESINDIVKTFRFTK